jgi:catechol 2,3-dioxygenase
MQSSIRARGVDNPELTRMIRPIAWASDSTLRIDRAHYAVLRAPDPRAASQFAVRRMGFTLVHVDDEGRHYLAAHGLDRYSLVYAPGDAGLDYMSYLVRSLADLEVAAAALAAAGVACERRNDSEMWNRGPALRFTHANGASIELATGVNVDGLMHWAVVGSKSAPAPITCDHAILRASDVAAANAFLSGVMGLRESGRIVAPDGIPVLTFFRAHTLYHCLGTARSSRNGLHHVAFTLKNDHALFAAHEAMRNSGEVEILWGPVRHGAGGNIAFYFRDQAGHILEFSAEEELILNDDTYTADAWPVSVVRASDEWGTHPPAAMMG